MGVNLNFDTFQVALTAEGVAQQVENPGIVPGAENPQISSMIIRALKSNLGTIYLGGSAANAVAAKGFELAAGDAVSLDIQGAGKIWMNGTKTNDRICVAWVGP